MKTAPSVTVSRTAGNSFNVSVVLYLENMRELETAYSVLQSMDRDSLDDFTLVTQHDDTTYYVMSFALNTNNLHHTLSMLNMVSGACDFKSGVRVSGEENTKRYDRLLTFLETTLGAMANKVGTRSSPCCLPVSYPLDTPSNQPPVPPPREETKQVPEVFSDLMRNLFRSTQTGSGFNDLCNGKEDEDWNSDSSVGEHEKCTCGPDCKCESGGECLHPESCGNCCRETGGCSGNVCPVTQ